MKEAIELCDMTYVVSCNNRAIVVYKDADGVERTADCSYGEDWFYWVNNPSPGQVFQLSVRVTYVNPQEGEPMVSAKIYSHGKLIKDDTKVGATATYAFVMTWCNRQE